MSQLFLDCEIISLQDRRRKATILQLAADPDSFYTWIESEILKKVGIKAMKEMQFVQDNGYLVTRSIGFAELRVGNDFTIDEIIFAQPGEAQVIGARAIAGFGKFYNPHTGQLEDVLRRVPQPFPIA
jgi:predicted aspartyl protease